MDVLITFVTVNKRGQEQRDQRSVAGPVLAIGRGSQSQLHLPDARVALDHARLSLTEGGPRIEAVDGVVEVNGRKIDASALATGDVVEIGPYDIRVEDPPAGVPLALSVKPGADFLTEGSFLDRITLPAPRVSKRRLSFLAFWGVLLLCLLVQVAPDFWHDGGAVAPDSRRAMLREVVPATADRFLQAWNPGPFSRSHQIFGAQCHTCHQQPFLQILDSACVKCHKAVKEHVPRAELTGVRAKEFLRTRCAQCHRDHKGTALAPRAQELCTNCHMDIKAVSPNARSEDVTDFSRKHPQFRLSLVDADQPKVVRRVRQSAPAAFDMIERSNLKYDHKVHLDPAGVRDPEKRRTVMKCADCHEPADEGRSMSPVSMQRHCQRCHLLAFEPKVTDRQVPHGSEKAVATTLREFYARLVLGDVPPGVMPPPDLPRVRPGAVLDYQERQAALRIADQRALRAMRELYETPRKVCSECHYITREGDAAWKVAPVRLSRVWMPKARFSHAAHAAEKCTRCHDVTRSTSARDIAMPNIALCRECHAGAQPVKDKVTSDCAMCHKLHAGRDYWHKALQTELQSEPAQ